MISPVPASGHALPRGARFITVEGIDGAGKSSHIAAIAEQLQAHGAKVVVTREPGGTAVGEAIRGLFLGHGMTPDTEALVFAARREHLERVVWPSLARGEWVVCDRFTDATVAYQGYGRGLGAARVDALAQWVHPGFAPGLTFLFDLAPEVARLRVTGRTALDRIEAEAQGFHERVREGYLARAATEPNRFCVLDATLPIEVLREMIARRLDRHRAEVGA
ncbi:MAG: dTMP kinase [Casimicrobiaceae bacterium]